MRQKMMSFQRFQRFHRSASHAATDPNLESPTLPALPALPPLSNSMVYLILFFSKTLRRNRCPDTDRHHPSSASSALPALSVILEVISAALAVKQFA